MLAQEGGKQCLHRKEVSVSLPREWFQEIKHMMTVNSTHGLFLTCTQESHLYLHNIQLTNIYTMCMQLLLNPLTKVIRTPSYLVGQFLSHGDKSPSTLVPCLVATATPFCSGPFTPFSPLSPYYTIYKSVINNHGLLRPGQYAMLCLNRKEIRYSMIGQEGGRLCLDRKEVSYAWTGWR
jgi:hypothetical protein